MFSAMRRRVTFVNVAVTFALVFAMSGGAFAAGKFLITSTKQIKPSVLAQLKGKTGPAGLAGTTGPAGPQGPAGAPGAEGKPGGPGPEGKTGATGPKGETGAKGATGPAGPQGVQGVAGAEGKEGSPWTAGGTLPSGKTETGSWILGLSDGKEHLSGSISFPIPLVSPVNVVLVTKKQVELEEVPVGCHATIVEGGVREIKADPGNLCVFETFGLGGGLLEVASTLPAENGSFGLASKSGVLLLVEAKEAGQLSLGAWVVTAP